LASEESKSKVSEIIPGTGGFIKDNNIPPYDKPKKTSLAVWLLIISGILILGLLIVFLIAEMMEPTFTQKDYNLLHECVLQLFWTDGIHENTRMICNPEKFYNNEMFAEISENIGAILRSEGIDANVTINPTPEKLDDTITTNPTPEILDGA